MNVQLSESAGIAGIAIGILMTSRNVVLSAKWHTPFIYLSGAAGAIVGSRIIGWALFQADLSFLQAVTRIFDESQYQSILGAILIGTPVIVGYCAAAGVPIGPVLDAGAPGVALAQTAGRVACTQIGCCYGRPTHVAWAVPTMPFTQVGTRFGIATVHPTALYELILDAALTIALLIVTARQARTWVRTSIYLIGYGSIRAFVQCFRGDVPIGSQNFIAIMFACCALIAGGVAAGQIARYATSKP